MCRVYGLSVGQVRFLDLTLLMSGTFETLSRIHAHDLPSTANACEITDSIIQGYLEVSVGHDFDTSKSMTSSGAALLEFKQRGIAGEHLAPTLKVQKCARAAYYGGMVGHTVLNAKSDETGKLYHYDVNSMYAAAMTEAYPSVTPNKTNIVEIDITTLDEFHNTWQYYVKAKFPADSFDKPTHVNLPVRQDDGLLAYTQDQTDEFRWRWGRELNTAITMGAEINVWKNI